MSTADLRGPAEDGQEPAGSRAERTSAAFRKITSQFTPHHTAETKGELLVRLVLFSVWVGAVIVLAFTQVVVAVMLFLVVMLLFGTTKVDEGHRGLPSVLGRRIPYSTGEGLIPVPPFIVSVRSIDIRERQTRITVRHQSADGLQHDVHALVSWHAPRSADERRSWFVGDLLLAYDNLDEGVDEERIIASTKQALEPVISSHSHDKLIGIHIYQLVEKLRAALESGASLDLGDTFARDSSIALRTRLEMSEQVRQAITDGLRGVGIIVTLVTIAEVNPDQTIVDLLEEIQRQFVEKSAQGLDLAGDVARAKQLCAAAKASSEELPVLEAYRAVRMLDNAELAAKTGLLPAALQQLTTLLTGKAA